MADSIFGVQSCGCITLWCTARDVDNQTEKSLARIIAEGGTVQRGDLDDVRDKPEFLPLDCPHDPKGWERKPKIPTVKFRHASKNFRGESRAYVETDKGGYWERRIGSVYRPAEIAMWEAYLGDEYRPERSQESLGQYSTRAAAGQALVDAYEPPANVDEEEDDDVAA